MSAATPHSVWARRATPLLVLVALVAIGCSRSSGRSSQPDNEGDSTANSTTETTTPADDGEPGPTTTVPAEAETVECDPPSWRSRIGVSGDGATLVQQASDTPHPTYAVTAAVDPVTGVVIGRVRTQLPDVGDRARFRTYPGLPELESGLEYTAVRVDGSEAEFVAEGGRLTIETPKGGDAEIEISFRYTIPLVEAGSDSPFALFSNDALSPASIGLLGRNAGGLTMGHWFPVWLPNGVRDEADPSGFGDVGAFPAASICASISVPGGYEVVTGGGRVDEQVVDGRTVITEAAVGLRDLGVVVRNDLGSVTKTVGDTTVRVWGPDGPSVAEVLDESSRSLRAIEAAFGPYPWAELDVVAAPLGSGVGGMEWPGMVWIDSAIFAGDLPGLGNVDRLGDLGELGEELGIEALLYTREWVVAHEIGHQWWHATVGNDSIEAPAVDEPLAQYSACVVMRTAHPNDWPTICEGQTYASYRQARGLGVADTAAAQPSDAFESSLQYGAVVYGKAPGLYFELAEQFGSETLDSWLASFVMANGFELVGTDALRDHLVEAAGDDGDEVRDLWDRWLNGAFGDEDIGTTDFGGVLDPDVLREPENFQRLEPFEGLGPLDELLEAIEELFESD